jgi:hypothetical protein
MIAADASLDSSSESSSESSGISRKGRMAIPDDGDVSIQVIATLGHFLLMVKEVDSPATLHSIISSCMKSYGITTYGESGAIKDRPVAYCGLEKHGDGHTYRHQLAKRKLERQDND